MADGVRRQESNWEIPAYLWIEAVHGINPLPRRACQGCLVPPLLQTVYLRWAEVQRASALRSTQVYAVGFRECSGIGAESDVSLAFSPDGREIGVRMPGSAVLIDTETGALRKLDGGDVPGWMPTIPPDPAQQACSEAVSPDGKWQVRITAGGRLAVTCAQTAREGQTGVPDGPHLP
jgi:hypothetical protein